MIKRRITALLCLALSAILLLSACGDNADGSTGSGSGGAKRTTLTVAQLAEPTTLDTLSTSDGYSPIWQPFDTLLVIGNDANRSLTASLATDWKMNEESTEITFTLRENVKMHNGATMTAEDVAFSINSAAASPFCTAAASSVDRAEVVDASTVKVYLKYPYGPALICFTMPAFHIVSKEAYEADPTGFGRNPVATGPFTVKEWSSGDKVVFEAFPDYWQGEPAIKELIFKIIPDQNTQVMALEKGEVDIIDNNPSPSSRDSFLANENLVFEECGSNAIFQVFFNCENGVFADKKLREVVAYALNRQDIIDGAATGTGTVLDLEMLPSIPEYPQDMKGTPYDPDKAKQLLADAGYPDGLTVKMKTIDSGTYIRPTEVIQDQLKKVGITVDIEILDRGKYMSDVQANADYDITFYANVAKGNDADLNLYHLFHSSNIGGSNYIRANNAELDGLLDQGRQTQEPVARREIYGRAIEIIRDEHLVVPLYINTRTAVRHKDLKGIQITPEYKFFYYMAYWE